MMLVLLILVLSLYIVVVYLCDVSGVVPKCKLFNRCWWCR